MIKENFHEAKQFFQNFLSEQGLSSDLLWVFGEDIICLPKRFLIKVPLPAENESFAEVCYNIGLERNLGLCLHAFCLLDGRPCCYIELPKDDLDAQYSLMGNLSLKCSVRNDLINAEPIDSFLVWQTYRLSEKFSDPRFSTLDKLPFRKALLQTA
jgi:hypothetical protein